jgi:hypothetical protein
MGTFEENQKALDDLMDDLKDIHDQKLELLETLKQLELNELIKRPSLLPIVSIVNWVKSDLHTVRGLTETLLEIARNLRKDVKRKKWRIENGVE